VRLAALAAVVLLCGTASADKLAYLEAKRDAPKTTKAERARQERRLRFLVGKKPDPIVNVRSNWNKETLAFDPRLADVDQETFSTFLRCHFTGQATSMDGRLLQVLAGAAQHFSATRIHIVSGFRAPKYNLILRKKGRNVARDSQHTYGHAVDFTIPGVPTARLNDYVRSLRVGGAGIYPESKFVHADTGPLRTWAGR
jgi:uncharacterized protein YcbK (DUF882 family)